VLGIRKKLIKYCRKRENGKGIEPRSQRRCPVGGVLFKSHDPEKQSERLVNNLSVPQHWSGQQQRVDAVEDSAMPRQQTS
jgi:hypothetical protein